MLHRRVLQCYCVIAGACWCCYVAVSYVSVIHTQYSVRYHTCWCVLLREVVLVPGIIIIMFTVRNGPYYTALVEQLDGGNNTTASLSITTTTTTTTTTRTNNSPPPTPLITDNLGKCVPLNLFNKHFTHNIVCVHIHTIMRHYFTS